MSDLSSSTDSFSSEELPFERLSPKPDLGNFHKGVDMPILEDKNENISAEKKKYVIVKSYGLDVESINKMLLELIDRTKLVVSNGMLVGMQFDNKPVMIRRKGGGICLSRSNNNKKSVRSVIKFVNKIRKSENMCLFDLSNPSDKIGLNKPYDITE